MNVSSHVRLLTRSSLGATFIVTAVGKAFAEDRSQLSLVSTAFPMPYNRELLIIAELALGMWLLSGVRVEIASAITMGLLSAFSVLIVVDLNRVHPLPCGCAGAVSSALDHAIGLNRALIVDLLRNVLLMTGAAGLFLFRSFKTSESVPT